MRDRRFALFAWGVLGFILLVILWGAFVRASGSGAGCGSHWPLCNGEVVPRDPGMATLIELTHRITSGIALILVAALTVFAWRRYPSGHLVRRAAVLSAVFIVTEALIGAGLVLLEHVATDTSLARGYWVGGHLVNTFLLIGALTLTAWWASGGVEVHLRAHGGLGALLAAALAGVLLLGVSGAITALGDTLFPVATLAEGKALTASESAHLFVRLRVWHPTLAVVVGIVIAAAAISAVRTRSSSAVRQSAYWLAVLYIAQLGLGLLNVTLLAPLSLQIAHLLLSDLIWIALLVLTASALAGDARSAPARLGAVRPAERASAHR